jgi:sec-independent protein translocase protein TatA
LLSGKVCLKSRLYPHITSDRVVALEFKVNQMSSIGVFAFMAPGVMQLVILAFIVMLLFGGSKLPTLMRNLGRSANEFKRGMSETDDDADNKDKNA